MESRGEGNNKEAGRFSCLMYDYDYELSQIGWLTTSSTSPISAIFRRRSLSSALKSCRLAVLKLHVPVTYIVHI